MGTGAKLHPDHGADVNMSEPLRRLLNSVKIGNELDGLSHPMIADLLREKVWAQMTIGSVELEIVEQAIDRLTQTAEALDKIAYADSHVTAEELRETAIEALIAPKDNEDVDPSAS